jgi:WD40 repeat protein
VNKVITVKKEQIMKEMKPKFELSRIYSDGTEEPAQIVPLAEAMKARMNRRGFFGAGFTAAAALMWLESCEKDDPEPSGGCKDIYAHDDNILALAVSPDGTRLFSGSRDKTVKIWSLPEGALLKTLTGHSGDVNALAISPDGTQLFSGSDDRTVKIWSLPEGAPVKTLTGHSGYITSLAVSPDGTRLFSG